MAVHHQSHLCPTCSLGLCILKSYFIATIYSENMVWTPLVGVFDDNFKNNISKRCISGIGANLHFFGN